MKQREAIGIHSGSSNITHWMLLNDYCAVQVVKGGALSVPFPKDWTGMHGIISLSMIVDKRALYTQRKLNALPWKC